MNLLLISSFQDKENAPQNGKKLRKIRLDNETNGNSKFYQSAEGSAITSSQESLGKPVMTRFIDQSFSNDGIIPSVEKAEEFFLGHTPVSEGSLLNPPQRLHSDPPPPLPPKPKNLPPATSWTPTNETPQAPSRPADKNRPCRIRRAVYLDQPSSSFV